MLRYVDLEQVADLVKRGTALAEAGQTEEATILLAGAAQVAERTGDRRKTRLIQEALQELETGGRIDRKTRLTVTDKSRRTRLMPEAERNA